MANKDITIVKVKRVDAPNSTPKQKFARMPRLYLELIENKEKIKKASLNHEYVHQYADDHSVVPSVVSIESNNSESTQENIDDDNKSESEINDSSDNNQSDEEDAPVDVMQISERSDEDISVVTENSDNNTGSDNEIVNMNDKLNQLLVGDTDTIASRNSQKSIDSKYSKKRDYLGRPNTKRKEPAPPPSLAQLQSNHYNYNTGNNDTDEKEADSVKNDDMKREMMFKFDLLRRSYPGSNIPTFTIHTDYDIMLSSYEDCIRRLSLDSSVESYKKYLIYGFMAFEYILGRFLKLDMEGFTQQQINSMSSYEKLLIELGEKSYTPDGSKWPIEVRLLGMIMMNAAFFVVSKIIIKKTGSDFMGMMNNMLSGNKSEKKPSTMDEPDDIDFDNV